MPRAAKTTNAGSTRSGKPAAEAKDVAEAPAPKAKAARKASAAKQRVSEVRDTTTKAKPARKAKGEPPVPADKFLAEQQQLLLAERATYTQHADALKAEADALALEAEPGDVQFDEESGEGDSMNVERERDLALSAQAMASVEEIDRALSKIEQGTYGVCEKCGEPIPRERLKALPHASLCVRCKSGGLGRR